MNSDPKSSSEKPSPPRRVNGSSSTDWLRLDSSPGGGNSCRPASSAGGKAPFPIVPGYEILGQLGRGGMGVVFKAMHVGLKRLVALKLISHVELASAESRDRFRVEAEKLASLQHDHIVEIYEVGEFEGRPFLALEYLDGGALGQWLTRLPPSPHQAAEVLEPLARAVQHAHDHGVIHSDLKPGNILLGSPRTPPDATGSQRTDASGRRIAKIVDFGLLNRLEASGGTTKTRPSLMAGTPQYMAPEQAPGAHSRVGPPADIYSLGTILYEMLTGRPPFEGSTAAETVRLLQTLEPIPPRRHRPGIPRDLETICLKCLEKEPSRRYERAADLADDLQRFLANEPVKARSAGWISRARHWQKCQPGVALSLILLAILICGFAVCGPIMALHYLSEAGQARADASLVGTALDNAREREHEHLLQLIHMNEQAARLLSVNHEPEQALLYFANASRLAREAGDAERAEFNEVCFRNWLSGVARTAHAVAALPPNSPQPRAWTLHPTGRWVIVQTRDRAHLWDLHAEKELAFPGSSPVVLSAAWSPDGECIALGCGGVAVGVHRFPSGELMRRLPHTGPVFTVRFDESGRRLAAGGTGVHVWDLNSGDRDGQFWLPLSDVIALSFSRRGDRLAAGCLDGHAHVFDLDMPKGPIFTAPWGIPSNSAESAAFVQTPLIVHDGKTLVTLDPDRRHVSVWEIAKGHESFRFPATNAPFEPRIDCCSTRDDGQTLVVGGSTGARVFDLRSGKLLATPGESRESNRRVLSAVFEPTNGGLLTGGVDQLVWSRPTDGASVPHTFTMFRPIVGVASLQDDRLIVAMQDDGFIRAWRQSNAHERHLQAPRMSRLPTVVVASPNGKNFITSGLPNMSSAPRSTQVCRSETGRPAGPILQAEGAIIQAALSPKSNCAALAVTLANSESERLEAMFGHGHDCNRIELWDWTSGRRTTLPIRMPSEPRCLGFDSKGSRLAAFCAGGQLLLIDPANGKITKTISNNPAAPKSPANWKASGGLRFTPDDRLVVAWGLDSTLRAVDVVSGEVAYSIYSGEGEFTHVEFVPGRDLIAAAHTRLDIAFWHAASGAPAAEIASLPKTDRTSTLRFSSDGQTLLTAGNNGEVRLWDWQAGRQVCPPLMRGSEVRGADFLPNSRWLFTARADGVIGLWDRKSGLSVAPDMRLKLVNCRNAVLAAGGRVVIAAGADGAVDGCDLTALLSPGPIAGTRTSAAVNLDKLARLIAGQELIDNATPVRLSRTEWMRLWSELSSSFGTNSNDAIERSGASNDKP